MIPEFEAAQQAYFQRRGIEAEPHRIELSRLKSEACAWVAGSGPPVVMLPGGPFIAASLAPLVAAAASDHTVYVVERPGVGAVASQPIELTNLFDFARAFVQDTLDALGLERVTLVGNSLGATLAIIHAVSNPSSVTRLILVSPPGGTDRELPAALKFISRPVLGKLLFATLARPSIAATRTMFADAMVMRSERVPEDLIELQTLAHKLPGAWMSWRNMVSLLVEPSGLRSDAELFETLPQLRVPVAMIWGDHDAVTPVERGEAVMRTIPELDMYVIQDAGHLMWIDQEQPTLRVFGKLLTKAHPRVAQ